MRSRNGNRSFSRTVSITLFFLFHSLALHASEYLISYRYLVENAILYNETLEVSHAMQKCKGKPYNPIIFPTNNEKKLKKILSENREDFVDYIHKLGLNLEYSEQTTNFQNYSRTILTLKTQCFKVDFNDTFVKISPLK